MKILKNLTIGALILLSSVQNASSDDVREIVCTERKTSNRCAIPYGHLATEKTNPYLTRGKHPAKLAERIAAWRFDDVRDCLVRSEAKNSSPNLALINWSKMRSEEIIEICMFRILSSLGTPQAAKKWFEIQGMQNVALKVRSASVVRDGRRVERIVSSVSASNNLSKTGRCYLSSGFLRSSLCAKFAHAETFTASWDEHNKLWGTGYGQTVK